MDRSIIGRALPARRLAEPGRVDGAPDGRSLDQPASTASWRPAPGRFAREPGIALVPGAVPGPPRATAFEVVAAAARLIGETLELRQVFARVAEAALRALTFDRMGVLLWEGGQALRHYAVAVTTVDGPGDQEGRLLGRDECSPRFWREFVVDRIDTKRELDPAYPRDREILAAGIRSIIRGVLRSGGRTLGVLAFSSRRPRAFTSEHEPVVEALSDLVAAALEHERLWTIERERSRRALALEGLLATLAQALDVRQVFKQVSASRARARRWRRASSTAAPPAPTAPSSP
jgi:GAF domain-containing protein